jgi:shikimate kinase
MMGSGKSSVARILGRLTGLPVISTDARIEALAGKPISRIFAEDGEPAFRARERQVVRSLRPPAVADLGGGAFCDAQSAERLLRLGSVVFLDVSEAEAARRIGGSQGRPLAPSWQRLLRGRLPLYRRASLRIEVDGFTAEAVARRVVAALRLDPASRGSTGEGP